MTEPRRLSHVDLKKLSLQLRDLAGRMLRSDHESAQDNIRRVLRFVEKTPLLRDAVVSAPEPTSNLLEIWQKVQNEGTRFPLPEDPDEELGLLHALLKMLAASSEEFWRLCYGYAGEHGVNEPAEQVLHDLGGKYVGHLRQLVEFAMLDSGDPALAATRHIRVELHGGAGHQVNVAADAAEIQAIQVREAGGGELIAAARDFIRLADDIIRRGHATAAVGEARELTESVAEELTRPAPRRFTLASIGARLKQLAELGESVTSLAPHLARVTTLIERVVQGLQ